MARGDHVRVFRTGYWHHGIDCGDGTVIHYTGELFNRANAAVRRTTLEQFAKGGRVRVVKSDPTFDAEAIISRAESRLEETRYSTVLNNCEHFASWCRTGQRESKQVRRAITGPPRHYGRHHLGRGSRDCGGNHCRRARDGSRTRIARLDSPGDPLISPTHTPVLGRVQ
ncbi:MAG: lecithin retinol acyltransferase family protein [Candidatus Hydrogenedentes bacterium]|nr:lecithin retinol acyltransferase family protein [Candidatus Hydrogenedentota bacterium]